MVTPEVVRFVLDQVVQHHIYELILHQSGGAGIHDLLVKIQIFLQNGLDTLNEGSGDVCEWAGLLSQNLPNI